MDNCQTPPYAIFPLLAGGLKKYPRVWEPAAGDGYLVEALRLSGFAVWETDILAGQDFFEVSAAERLPVVTNPPFSTKHLWLAELVRRDVPFALLFPFEAIMTERVALTFKKAGDLQIVGMLPRLAFKMPRVGWKGSSPQFPVCWITRYLKFERQFNFCMFGEDYIREWKKRLATLPDKATREDIRRVITPFFVEGKKQNVPPAGHFRVKLHRELKQKTGVVIQTIAPKA